MHQQHDPSLTQYPHGRGYGHDYMRGGEVLGGYGYAAREEYERPIGELTARSTGQPPRADAPPGADGAQR